MKDKGFFNLHRSIWTNPIITKDSDYFLVWIYMLSQAEWEDGKVVDFGNKKITLKAGQFTCGIKRQMLHDIQTINPSLTKMKLYRIVKCYSDAKQIETQKSARCSLFTILNWNLYQKNETQIATKSKLKRNSHETKMGPNKINKEINKKEKNNMPSAEPTDEEWELMKQDTDWGD